MDDTTTIKNRPAIILLIVLIVVASMMSLGHGLRDKLRRNGYPWSHCSS